MNVSVLQVNRCKRILGLDAFDNAPARQHLERELVQSPVKDSLIQDWLLTTFLGYDEVRAVKPLPHLGWRDRLDCILCQEDSNLLAQDKGVPDCHRRLENAVELAESNCACEPARQAGQHEPRLQMLCKRLQRHNRRTDGGAAKGSRGGWYRSRCVLRHPHRTPWVPNETGQRCVGRYIVPEPYSLEMALPLSHLGNARIPPGSPAVEVSKDGGDGQAASGCERGHPRLRQLLMHLREKRHQRRARLCAAPRSEKPIIQLRGLGTGWSVDLQPDTHGCPGKHGRQLWVRCGVVTDR